MNLLNRIWMLYAPDDGKGGDGGGATPTLESQAAEITKLKADLEAATKAKPTGTPPPKADDTDILDKLKREKEATDAKNVDVKALTAAIKFDSESESFLKNNAGLLPSDTADIFKAVNKETYSTPVEKDRALKSALFQRYFQEQANVDQLTQSQKVKLDEYLKLTKTGKEEKAQAMFEDLFEPVLEMSRKIKRANEIAKGQNTSPGLDPLKEKMMKHSNAHYRIGDRK